ncbi:hypothetical protein IVB21_04985 [Bradyrhizobium sp. 18]|nr:hypothetical protein [Bradyrhizobium sp. 18]
MDPLQAQERRLGDAQSSVGRTGFPALAMALERQWPHTGLIRPPIAVSTSDVQIFARLLGTRQNAATSRGPCSMDPQGRQTCGFQAIREPKSLFDHRHDCLQLKALSSQEANCVAGDNVFLNGCVTLQCFSDQAQKSGNERFYIAESLRRPSVRSHVHLALWADFVISITATVSPSSATV